MPSHGEGTPRKPNAWLGSDSSTRPHPDCSSSPVLKAPPSPADKRNWNQVVHRLLDEGAAVRMVVRGPSRLDDSVRERVQVVVGSHGDGAVEDEAFAGASAVFWLVPPGPVELGYWITPGRASRLGSSLSDHFVRLPARTLRTRPPDGDDAAGVSKDAELLVLRYENTVLRRQIAGFVTSQRTGYSSFTT